MDHRSLLLAFGEEAFVSFHYFFAEIKKKKSHAQDNSQMTVHLDHDSRRVKCPTQWGSTTASSRHGSRKPRDHILYHKQEVESKLEVEKG